MDKVYIHIPEGYVEAVLVKEKKFLFWTFYKVRVSFDFFQHRDYHQIELTVKTIYRELPEGGTLVRPTLSFEEGVKGHPSGYRS